MCFNHDVKDLLCEKFMCFNHDVKDLLCEKFMCFSHDVKDLLCEKFMCFNHNVQGLLGKFFGVETFLVLAHLPDFQQRLALLLQLCVLLFDSLKAVSISQAQSAPVRLSQHQAQSASVRLSQHQSGSVLL